MNQRKQKTLAEWLNENEKQERKNLLVYEMTRPKIRPEFLAELAKNFKLEGELKSEKDMFFLAQERQATVLYKETGAFWYVDFSKLGSPAYRPKLPDEKKALTIANEFLKKNDLLPEFAKLDSIHVSNFEQIEGKRRKKRTVRPNNMCVQYRCSFNQLDTYGPGAKIKVFIGNNGEIIGLFHALPMVNNSNELITVSGKELKTVLSNKLRIPLDKITVSDVKLAYHAESCIQGKRFMQPVYIFDLITKTKSKRLRKAEPVEFEMHPVPATSFAPVVTINESNAPIKIRYGEPLSLTAKVTGGTAPFSFNWESDKEGHLGIEPTINLKKLSVAQRQGRITSHTIKVTVIDKNGMSDSQSVLVTVEDKEGRNVKSAINPMIDIPNDPYVGVEWCNNYDDAPGLANISGTDNSARGFKNLIQGLPNWSSRFDWGNSNAWEQDFKYSSAPGGGDDTNWADNVHFAFFAGHGSSGRFYFNSSVDDHIMIAEDARLGDGILNWLVLHACQTMRSNFEWDVWCDAFRGLHQMFGFHTNTQGSTPPLGSQFAFWLSFRILPWLDAFDMQTAWRLACTECFDSSREYAVIYAGQTGTDTYNDHLPEFGHVSADPTSPTFWVYYKASC